MYDISIYQAGILGFIENFFTVRAFEAAGAILLILTGLLTKKYILPLLKTAIARQTAEHLLIIADDITDYFMVKYPEAHWSKWFDRAVDKIIEITGIGRATVERVARASIGRKLNGELKSKQKLEGIS